MIKNDGGVVKIHANQTYKEIFALAVRHGKMTEARRGELLDKIAKVASNDVTAFAGTESDIKVSKNDESGEIVVDMCAHFIKTDQDKEDYMNVSYATAKCFIQNATLAQQQKAEQLVHRIIQTSLKGMNMPGGEAERAQIEESLAEVGKRLMV